MRSGLRMLTKLSKPPVPLSQSAFGRLTSLSGSYADKSMNEGMLRTYRNSGTVFQIVSLLAQSVATPEWHLYRKAPVDGRRRYTTGDKGSDQRVEVVTHAAKTLWDCPNSFQTRFELLEATAQHLELTGEGWWILDRSQVNFPTSMWLVRPDRIEPIPDRNSYLQGFMYSSPDGEQIPLKLSEVLMLKYPDPEDPFRGASPVRSIMADIDGMKFSSQWNRNFFMNSAEPGGQIVVPNRLGEGELDELIDRWREQHRGVARAHRVGVLENGASWIPNDTKQRDMEFTELRKDARDVIREAWGIHKSMLGNADDVNRANAQTAEEVFGTWKVIPRLNRIRMYLNHRLLPMYGTTGEGVEFDYDDPVPANREADTAEMIAKANAAKALVGAGYDPHDVLEVVGLPDMDVAEKATQAPALPPSWVPAPPATPAPEPTAAEKDQAVTDELTRMMSAYLDEHRLNGFAKGAW